MRRQSEVSPWGDGILPSRVLRSPWDEHEEEIGSSDTSDPLPKAADIVVIGSGLSGAAVAYHLLSMSREPLSIVVLEARGICSGATGRNAGHCRPDAFRGFLAYAKLHGKDQAKQILKSERITFEKVDAFVQKYNIDCEWQPRDTVDVCLTDKMAQSQRNAYDAAKDAGVGLSEVAKATDGLIDSPYPDTSFQWEAASVNPTKLCLGVHRINRTLGDYLVFPFTPVTSVSRNYSKDAYDWLVHTPRGTVKVSKVVYATNAYTKLILPEFEDLITPYQAQGVEIPSTSLLHSARPLGPTLSLRHDIERFTSVMQRKDGSIILASPRVWLGQSPQHYGELFGTMDDSDEGHTRRAKEAVRDVEKVLPDLISPLNSLETSQYQSQYRAWTGILGLTPDAVPFVGSIPGKPGQYMIAGFNGHGMARIFHCAPCLAGVILGGESKWDPEVPRVFSVTSERLDRLKRIRKEEGVKPPVLSADSSPALVRLTGTSRVAKL